MVRNFLLQTQVEKFSEPQIGVVEQTISPQQPGRVKFKGTSWPAQFYDPTFQGIVFIQQPVTIVGRKGLTMLVIPIKYTQEFSRTA
jgi:membrane protein implicated in regulation of membrane protease activity